MGIEYKQILFGYSVAKIFLLIASLSGALAVMLGAFGAHALKDQLVASSFETYQTAVFYHFVHTLALLVSALWWKQQAGSLLLLWSAVAYTIGLLLFCGSLYCLALGGPRWLGPITPLGGLSLMAGWLTMAAAVLRI